MQDHLELRWDDVRMFLALYREPSLSRAGKRLSVDGSTLSRRLAQLEDRMDARLFDRTREGLRATRAAELLFPAAERMEAAALEFVRETDGFERAVEGRVRLTAPPGIAEVFIPRFLPELKKRHPKVVLEIDSRIAVTDLGRREADLALRSIRPTSGELVVQRLTSMKPTLLASPGYARELGRLKHVGDARYIVWSEALASLGLGTWLARHAPDADIGLVTDSYPCQLRSAEAGAGLVVAPPIYGSFYELVEVDMSRSVRAAVDEMPAGELYIVGHAAMRDVPRVAAVWSFVVDAITRVATGADAPVRRASR
jgi:DNA-binding transcriptional LysR family regulator